MLSALARRPRAAGALARALAPVGAVRNHCQVPCGIFDDPAKVSELKQDAATIRKAMVQTNELGTKDALSLNRIYSFVNLSPWAVEAWGNAAHVTDRAAQFSLHLDSRSDPRAF